MKILQHKDIKCFVQLTCQNLVFSYINLKIKYNI